MALLVATTMLGSTSAEENSDERRSSRKLWTVTSCRLNYPMTKRMKSAPQEKKKIMEAPLATARNGREDPETRGCAAIGFCSSGLPLVAGEGAADD
ncbi:unnamed protein product [Linum trigynum]|uniref:Secreted protein n=1 Tax=Linum trigynum TaxID=586398 RepID=A0AAV2E953_9ROSI